MSALVIVAYDPSWPRQFEEEADRLRKALGEDAVRIDHVGSTSVPELAAKPVIDIQIAVRDDAAAACIRARLKAVGYTHTADPFPYFHRPAVWPHTHHIHVRELDSVDERRTRAFRDWLRAHPGDRESYEALKHELAEGASAATAEGRFRYSEAKTDFIREIERRSGAQAPSPETA